MVQGWGILKDTIIAEETSELDFKNKSMISLYCVSQSRYISLTLACRECERRGSGRTDGADREGSDHHRVLCLSLESRYLSSSA